jgi:putative ABC transport system permease protein
MSCSVESLSKDARYAARALTRSPKFSLVVVLSLALGIGATVAIFSVVRAVLLRPLPYPNPDRLVSVWTAWEGAPRSGLSPAEFLDYRENVPAFQELGVYADGRLIVAGEEPQSARAGFVSASLFPALGVTPLVGRTFTPEEDRPDRSAVVVLSHGLWLRSFGGSLKALGQRLILDGETHTVIGVMPRGFGLPEDLATGNETELYVPLALDPATIANRGSHFLDGIAHIRAGVDVQAALESLRARAAESVREFPDDYPAGMRFTATGRALSDDVVADVRRPLVLLFAAVAVLLLIACANVAGLSIARGEKRGRELAVRSALGAGRARLSRTLLLESLLLAGFGGLVGTMLALWGANAALGLRPDQLAAVESVRLDGQLLVFALAASLMSGVVSGIAPALTVAGRDMHEALRGGARMLGSRRQRFGKVLVVEQIALAIVLLVAAGLLARSLARLLAVDPGYATREILAVDISLPEAAYAEDPKVTGFYSQLVKRLAQLPGVRAAGAVSNLPLATDLGDLNIEIEGRSVPEDESSPDADWQAVTAGYLEAMGIPLLQGRLLSATDDERAPGAVVINRRMARLYWPGEDPIGRRFKLGGEAGPGMVTVVGVVGDVRHRDLTAEPRPQMYLLHSQFRFWGSGEPVTGMTLVLRSLMDPASLGRAVAREVHALDPAVPVQGFVTMEQVRSAEISGPRFATLLIGAFSMIALTLAIVGLYALMAYRTSQRTAEIGVRMALGASARQVLGLVLRQASGLVAVGAALGLLGAVSLSRLLVGLLYDVSPIDPPTLAVIVTLVAVLCLAAGWIPARRAARLEPTVALRME